MALSDSTENSKQEKRITDLESSLMHLQNDYDTLNQVVLENANRLEKLSALIAQLNQRLDAASSESNTGNLEDEKPPHY